MSKVKREQAMRDRLERQSSSSDRYYEPKRKKAKPKYFEHHGMTLEEREERMREKQRLYEERVLKREADEFAKFMENL